MTKRIVSLALALALMASAFVGCGNSQTTSSNASATASAADDNSQEGKTINACVGPEPLTIDPALNQAADVTSIIQHVFAGLTRHAEDNSVVNDGAKDIKLSDDHKTYTITLRDDVKWSDGKPVTAGDYVYAWQRTVDPKTASQYAYIFDPVLNANEIVEGKMDKSKLGVKAVDDKTLEVTLRNPCPYFEELLSFTAYFPVRKDVVEGNEKWTQDPKTYIGNGPYMMKAWNHKENITLVKNPNYFEKDKIKVGTIKFALMEDEAAMLAAYQNGELDFIYPLSMDEMDAWKDKPDFHKTVDYSINFVDLNVTKKPFDNPKVRKALSLAIDRNYLAEKVAKGTQVPAKSFVPYGVTDLDPSKQFCDEAKSYYSIKPEDYEKNVAEAKKLLAEAGYPDGKGFPTFEYAFNTGGLNQAFAEAIQNMWKTELGINCTLSQQEWAVFIDTRNKGNYQTARDGWGADFNDPVTFLDLFVSDGGNNSCKYSNPEYDKLIAQVKSTDDNKVRIPALHKAEDLLMEDMPVIPLTIRSRCLLMNPKIKGYYATPFGFDYFMYATLED